MEDLWTLEGLLLDKNNDGVPDGVSLYIDLPDNLYPLGLLDFMVRVGLETTALSFNFFEFTNQKVVMSFEKNETETRASFESGKLHIYYTSEEALSSLLSSIAGTELRENLVKDNAQSSITSISDIWTLSGFGYLQEASPQQHLNINIGCEKWNKQLFKATCNFAARLGLVSTSITLPIAQNKNAEIQFIIQQHNQSFIEVPKENIIQLNGSLDQCANMMEWLANERSWKENGVLGAWENAFHYAHFKNKEETMLEVKWDNPSEIELAEKHLESLANNQIQKVEVYVSEPLEIRSLLKNKWSEKYKNIQEITVRSSFKPGFHWIKEELIHQIPANAKKIKIKVKEHHLENSLELPIRWIQELYPIDAIIENETSISKENVQFELDNQLKHTYEVVTLLDDGTVYHLGSLDVECSKVPYVDGERFAAPTTSCIVFSSETGKAVMHFPSDRERFYQFYLTDFLPQLLDGIGEIKGEKGLTQPLFDQMEVEVWMSEEEERLSVNEERTSPLEALYEDIYFNTLDYFEDLGTKLIGKPYIAVGAVVPIMHVAKGENPRASIKVTKWHQLNKNEVKTKELFFEKNVPTKVRLEVNGHIDLWDIDELLTMWEQTKIDDTTVPNSVLVDYSFRGHPIHVIEKYLPSNEQFDNPLKMTLFKPTVLIECAHHPNEVSSNIAVHRLLERLESNNELLKKINIVAIPLANPDGHYLLKKLTKEHPEWKHHAARYNAVGLEFAHIRYKNTIFGESNVLPELMKRWAPDVVIDNHGIPAHEWVQPFAGYNSPPRFPVSYFIPSAKIYGIGRYSNELGTDVARENLEKIVKDMSEIYETTNIPKQNEYWRSRFRKYGHDWLPEIFPLEVHGNINFYKERIVTPTYSAVSILRYPEWVAADIISEVADEVVYGDVLEECVEAQYLFNLSILQTVSNSNVDMKRNGNTLYRERPLEITIRGEYI